MCSSLGVPLRFRPETPSEWSPSRMATWLLPFRGWRPWWLRDSPHSSCGNRVPAVAGMRWCSDDPSNDFRACACPDRGRPAFVLTAGSVLAGEVTGNDKPTPINAYRANSICALSGQSDGKSAPRQQITRRFTPPHPRSLAQRIRPPDGPLSYGRPATW